MSALVLWPSCGGHWVEVWFLNWLPPRLPVTRTVQVCARVAVWFIAGVGLTFGIGLSAVLLAGSRRPHWPVFVLGRLAIIAIELIAHLGLQISGRPSFYGGRG